VNKCIHTVYILRECFHVRSEVTYYQDAILSNEIMLGERKDDSSCAFCLEEFSPRSRVVWCRGCGHAFHQKCQFIAMRSGMDFCALCKTQMHSHWMQGELFEGGTPEDRHHFSPVLEHASVQNTENPQSRRGEQIESGRDLILSRTRRGWLLGEVPQSDESHPLPLDEPIQRVGLARLQLSPWQSSDDTNSSSSSPQSSDDIDEEINNLDMISVIQETGYDASYVPVLNQWSTTMDARDASDLRLPSGHGRLNLHDAEIGDLQTQQTPLVHHSDTPHSHNGGDERSVPVPGSLECEVIPSGTTHPNTFCENCMASPIEGRRWRCRICPLYSLCATCYGQKLHDHHPFEYRDLHYPNNLEYGWKMPRRQHSRAALVRERLREGNARLQVLIQRAREERAMSLHSLGEEYDETGDALLNTLPSMLSDGSATTNTVSRVRSQQSPNPTRERTSLARERLVMDGTSSEDMSPTPNIQFRNPFATRHNSWRSAVSGDLLSETTQHRETSHVEDMDESPAHVSQSPPNPLRRSRARHPRAVQRVLSRNRNQSDAENQFQQDIVPLDALPTQTLSDESLKTLAAHSECCSICLEEYKVGDIVRTLVCFHNFHKDCIDEWFCKCPDETTCCVCKTTQPIDPSTLPRGRVASRNQTMDAFQRALDGLDMSFVANHRRRSQMIHGRPPQHQLQRGRRHRRNFVAAEHVPDTDDPSAHIRNAIAVLPRQIREELTVMFNENGVL